jgi:hypothetical protein
LKSIRRATNSASAPAHPTVRVTRFKISSIEGPVEKAIMPPSEILRDGIVQKDQGYPFTKTTGPEPSKLPNSVCRS